MEQHETINYVEFPARDFEATKIFFTKIFNWQFTDYGPDYTSFINAGLNGGFFKSDQVASTDKGSALVVFYSQDIKATQAKIEQANGKIVKPIFQFPGGCRFHFTDPNGNEFAVWSDKVPG